MKIKGLLGIIVLVLIFSWQRDALPSNYEYFQDKSEFMNTHLIEDDHECSGVVRGRVIDETGKSVSNFLFLFPLEQESPLFLDYYKDKKSNEEGYFQLDISEFVSEEQMLRVIPPWGREEEQNRLSSINTWWDGQKPIHKLDKTNIQIKISKGHNLNVELLPSPQLYYLKEYYSQKQNVHKEIMGRHFETIKPYFAISSASLVSLEPRDELIYHHYHEIPGGERITTQTLMITIPNVPLGSYGLRLDGGIYTPPPGEVSERDTLEYFPIIYTDITMPSRDYNVTVQLNEVDIIFELTGRPRDYETGEKEESVILFNRTEPVSNGLSCHFYKIMKSVHPHTGREFDSLKTPFVSYLEGFLWERYDKTGYEYRTPFIHCVPPGEYRLIAFLAKDYYDMVHGTPKGFYEKSVTIPQGKKKITLKVPYK